MCCLKENLLSNHIPEYLQESTLIGISLENFEMSLTVPNLSTLD